MHTALLTEEGTLQSNDGCLGHGKTASNDGGGCSGHAGKGTEGIRLHGNEHISPMSVRNLTKEASPERAAQGERTARKARVMALECMRYDKRTSRVGRRA
ncbi:hypothetical protein M404DRAFT_1000120 [Pisolithus tinctorius Marx 270]|uniref:Uncharacterized protein n=1 Tax=Pisolithus tinctorius Marx 270 TaxID=870435 RepID=A0A0C3PAT0_PISTI|nr:hypothetical protein M404DRAFT_1000120 [Pisolithus tinctorius Marx 270]